jgi:predicted porin
MKLFPFAGRHRAGLLSCGLLLVSTQSWCYDFNGTEITASGRVAAGVDVTTDVANNNSRGDRTGSGTSLSGASNQWATSLIRLDALRPVSPTLQAYGTLESGFGADAGMSNDGNLWSRRSYVGLKGTSWGHLQFGKNLAVSNGIFDTDPMSANWSGAATLIGGRNWNLANSAIEYGSPTFGGWTATLQYAPEGRVGDTDAGTSWGAGLSYSKGPLMLQFIYDQVACGWRGNYFNCRPGTFSELYTASKEYSAGAAYQYRNVKWFVGWTHLDAPDAGLAPQFSQIRTSSSATSADQVWWGLNWQVSSPLMLRAAVYAVEANRERQVDKVGVSYIAYGGKSAQLYTLGLDYKLDKNVGLWGTLTYVNNSSDARYAASNFWSRVPEAGHNQTSLNGGVIIWF